MEQTIEIDGLRMRYDRIGDGPQAVIIMHGWGCKASTVQVLADAAAAPATTVYNLDLPGFGGSQEPRPTGAYTTMPVLSRNLPIFSAFRVLCSSAIPMEAA